MSPVDRPRFPEGPSDDPEPERWKFPVPPRDQDEATKIGNDLPPGMVPYYAPLPYDDGRLTETEGYRLLEHVADLDGPEDESEDSDAAADGEAESNLADEEAREFSVDTIKNVCLAVGRAVVDMHGLGLLYRAAECVVAALKWSQMAEGTRGLEMTVPIPAGPLSVEISAHFGGDGPPVTACIGVSGDSPVGALVVDEVEAGPGERLRDTQGAPTAAAPPPNESASPRPDTAAIEPVFIDCPPLDLSDDDPDATAASLRQYAKDNDLPGKLRRRAIDKSEYVTVWHSSATVIILLIYIDGDSEPSWHVEIWESDGHFMFTVRRLYPESATGT
jgi:hypothetical protein